MYGLFSFEFHGAGILVTDYKQRRVYDVVTATGD